MDIGVVARSAAGAGHMNPQLRSMRWDELDSLAKSHWNDVKLLAEISTVLEPRRVPKAKELKEIIDARMRALSAVVSAHSTDRPSQTPDIPGPAPSGEAGRGLIPPPLAQVRAIPPALPPGGIAGSTPQIARRPTGDRQPVRGANTPPTLRVNSERGERAASDIEEQEPRTVGDDMGDALAIDAPGFNTLTVLLRAGSRVADVSPRRSWAPNIPTSVVFPLLSGDEFLAGDEALKVAQGSGDNWPPISRVEGLGEPNGASDFDRNVLQGRLLLLRCWDALRGGIAAHSDFAWTRPDDLPEVGAVSAGRGIGLEVASGVARYPDASLSKLVVCVPDWLGDIGQQQILDGISHATRRISPNSVRLLWRPVSVALAWLDGLPPEEEHPSKLSIVYAGFGGLEVSELGVRPEGEGQRRVLCPVRTGSPSLPPSSRYMDGLIKCGRETSVAGREQVSDRALASRIMGGKLRFARTEEAVGEGEPELDLDSNGEQSRELPSLEVKSSSSLEAEAGRVARGVRRDGRTKVLVFGPTAAIVEAIFRRVGVDHIVVGDDYAVRGGIVFADRLRKGLPTYFDRLQRLSLFAFKKQEPHWEDLIPLGEEVAGDMPFNRRIPGMVKVIKDQRSQSLESYLRREGSSQLRFLKTSLEEVASGEEVCDLVIEARSAGGLPTVRATPTTRSEIFGKSGSLLLDWRGMDEVAPNEDGWPPVKLRFGWPNVGQIYSAKNLFEKLLETAESVDEMLTAHRRPEALQLLEAALETGGAAKASRSLKDAKREVQQFSPIDALRPIGTTNPATYLDPDTGKEYPIPGSLHERMTKAASSLCRWHSVLRADGARLGRDQARKLEVASFRFLSWLGSYMPEEISTVLQKKTEESPNNEHLTAFGRCMKDSKCAAFLSNDLVTRKLGLRSGYVWPPASVARAIEAGGTTYFLKCFVYLTFQHDEILERCDRGHVCVLAWHASALVTKQVAQGRFAQTFVMALRTVALSLRFRRFCSADDPFLGSESHSPLELKALLEIRRALDGAIEALKVAIEALKETGKKTRDGKYALNVQKKIDLVQGKINLVQRVRDWLEWRAETGGWIVVYEDEDGGDSE